MASSSSCMVPNPVAAAAAVLRSSNIFPSDFRVRPDERLSSSVTAGIHHFSGVRSSTGPILMVSDLIMSTLFCKVCRRIFHPPVATCINGHMCCSECVREPCRRRTCKICLQPIKANSNLTIEKQLTLVPVRCTIAQCGKLVTASEIYRHYGVCEFRPIVCKYKQLINGRDCGQIVPYNEIRLHLTVKHPGVQNYIGDSPDGFTVCDFRAAKCNIDDIFHAHYNLRASREGLWAAVVVQFEQVFVVSSYMRGLNFYFWVSALLTEADAMQYSALFRYFDKDEQNRRIGVDLPRHRIHSIQSSEGFNTRVRMPFVPARNIPYNFINLNSCPDICAWSISVKIEKDEPDIVIVEPPRTPQIHVNGVNGHVDDSDDGNAQDKAELSEDLTNSNPEPDHADSDDEGRLIIDE